MNREDVIRIAKEVWGDDSGKPWHESALVHLEAFAKLVAAAEREACAVEVAAIDADGWEFNMAAIIRARSKQ